MEALKIVAMCLWPGVLYVVVHDQITARVCLQYFTVYHPHVFATHSPTFLALGWGVLATWWVSVILGILLAIAARAGSGPKVAADDLFAKVLQLLIVMALCSFAAGTSGYFLQGFGMEYYATDIPKPIRQNFYADLWAHSVSYLSGFVGGIVLCVIVWRGRGRASTPLKTGSALPWDQPPQGD